MKKKKLSLKIEKVSHFDADKMVGGTASLGGQTYLGCTCGDCPIDPPGDVPTIRDSCFSWCDGPCNEW